MNKARSIALVLLASWVAMTAATPALATSVAARAADIKISGTGPAGADAKAVQRVRQALANGFAANVIDKIIIKGYGFEGGFIACVEANPQNEGKFLELLGKLRTLKINPKTTQFAVEGLPSCASN